MESFEKSFVQFFRESSPYIHRFRGKTFVIGLSGSLVYENYLHSIVQDIALMNSLGIRIVLVHGAMIHIDAKLQASGIETYCVGGIRVTSPDVIHLVKEVVGAIRVEIEAALSMGLANSPMEKAKVKISSGNFVVARPLGVLNGVDFGYTGCVRSVDKESIKKHLELGEIVLLSPIGYSTTGEAFNLSYPDVAASTAIALKSAKLIYMVRENGLLNGGSHLIRELALDGAESYLHAYSRKISDSLRHKVELSIAASKKGVKRVHIINGMLEGSLLRELFTRDGIGTMIASDAYANIRQADPSDISGILRLIRPLEKKGVLVKRPVEELENKISQFYVFERDNVIIACANLVVFEEEAMAEIGCLAVNPADQKKGRGRELLIFLENRAKQLGVKELFVLSTQTSHWFLEHGYQLSSIDRLPQQKKERINMDRNSKALFKII